MTPTRKPVEILATGLDEAGHGTGVDADGRTLHVTDLLPGERAEVVVEHQSPHRPEAWARVRVRSGALSDIRTSPACPAWGRCGGCAWQHVDYQAQLVHKRARVVAALGLGEDAVAAAVPSPAELEYRHKGKYVAGLIRSRITLGAWAPRKHELVDTAGCRVVTPIIDELRERVRRAADRQGLTPWDERLKVGWLRYVIIRAAVTNGGSAMSDAPRLASLARGNGEDAQAQGGNGGPRETKALVVLVVRHDAPESVVLEVARTVAGDPRVVGVVRVDNDRDDGGLLDGEGRVLIGEGGLNERIAGVEVALGAGEFAQVNPAQAEAMYARVAELAEITAGERVADVYAGLGGISFALAARGAHVVAIERDAGAIAALQAAAARAGLAERIETRTGDAALLAEIPDVAAVVVNPPRKGLTREVIDAIAAGTATRVVYMSCGPESLGRDLALLAAAGFRPDVIAPYDLMPGTAQIETIVRLRRARG